MSQWDIKALEANFEGFQKERFPNLSRSEAFERYTVRQVLRDADLSDDEVESGIVGGEDDGGIDAIYFFVNRTLIEDETDLPDSALEATLFIFQTKMESGFSETAVQKMESFTRDLLDHNRPATDLLHLNSDVRDAIVRFRENYDKKLASQHTMTVTYIYATKSDQEANPKVISRVSSLRSYVKEQLSDSRVEFQFWGCKQLVAAARRVPRTTKP
jgi:hypothetical protein